jgi:regulator of protease activity HflC (stomatin/prohibitin superfamily)
VWFGVLVHADAPNQMWKPLLVAALTAFAMRGLFVVNPNEARAVLLFGHYLGTVKQQGFHWVHPLTLRPRVSLRVRNFESAKLKVNDHVGSPIEIAAVVVWRVVDTAEALFEVDDYKNFVQVQSEAALRNLATSYPYDAHVEGETSLRSHTTVVADQLKREIQDRLAKAGVEVLEARISHLAYCARDRERDAAAPAGERRRRRARTHRRGRRGHGRRWRSPSCRRRASCSSTRSGRAAMVSNLLVVLCSDRHTQPVVNTGTLYQ